ncbi:MAG: hypothetical protein ONB13_10800, partial [candidate division KSB1 bacterium]|nr:hypothetical protein [candidate division KSB1 bacterium]
REGLTHHEWQRWRKFILRQTDGMSAFPPDPLSFVNFYSALSTLDKYGTLRHYAFCRGYWPMQRSSAEFLLLENLVDGSGAGIVTLNYIFPSGLTAWIRGEGYVGKRNSEFGLLFFRSTVLLGAKYGF